MTFQDSRKTTTWLRWLGIGSGQELAPDAIETGDLLETELPWHDAPSCDSTEMLERISAFLKLHGLPVTPFTLEVAHDVVTRANPVLAGLIAEQVGLGQPISVRWLEQTADAEDHDDGASQIHELAKRLECAIAEFAGTASAAHTATNDYNSVLEAHVDNLNRLAPDGDKVLEITALARDMLSQTRVIVREMNKSERETRALQKRLADARHEAEIDHLTGLPNRRAFESMLRHDFQETRKSGEDLCVAFCDIDEFKRINDNHGHEAGDRVLRAVAHSLATISDEKCHVARHGGEEFVVLLRGRSLDEACEILDGARETLAARRLINRSTDVPFGRITLSAGVAYVPAYRNEREALRAADEALFKAKEGGRNRVVRAVDDPGPASAAA